MLFRSRLARVDWVTHGQDAVVRHPDVVSYTIRMAVVHVDVAMGFHAVVNDALTTLQCFLIDRLDLVRLAERLDDNEFAILCIDSTEAVRVVLIEVEQQLVGEYGVGWVFDKNTHG